MILIFRILFSIIVLALALAGYGLITRNFEYEGYMILFLAFSMSLLGIQEILKGKKGMGWLLIAVSAFNLYVSIQSFMWRRSSYICFIHHKARFSTINRALYLTSESTI